MTEMRKQFLFDIFVTACEGGIGYWARFDKYHWKGNQGYSNDEDWDGFFAEVEDEDTEKKYRIDREVIVRGLRLFHDGGAKVSHDLLAEILAANTENDAGNIDAGSADCIVQAGLFGEVIYG